MSREQPPERAVPDGFNRPQAQRLIDEIAAAGDIHGAVKLQRIADELARLAAFKGFGLGVTVASFVWWFIL